MDAILYTTNTGSTERYAKLLSEATSLPAYSLADGKRIVPRGARIIYLGWIMAGSIRGFGDAAKRYDIRAVCGVGVWQTGTQTAEVRKKTPVPTGIPLFTLQGGFDVNKLTGIYRPAMELLSKAVVKGLSEKSDRTPAEDDMLDMMLHGGDRVRRENLGEVLEWFKKQEMGV